MKTLLVATMAILMAGCGVTSDVPLRAKEGEALDTRLLGAWRVDGQDGLYYHIGAEGGQTKVIAVQHSDDGGVESMEGELHATCLASGCYMSHRPVTSKHKDYMILRYELMADGSLAIQIDASGSLRDAIRQKRLKGSIEDNGPLVPDTIHLNATEAELRDYLAKHGADAFTDKPVVLRKLAPTSDSSAADE